DTGTIETTLLTPGAVIFHTGASGVVEMYRISELHNVYGFVYFVPVLAALYPPFTVCVAAEAVRTPNVNIGC
uniref:hypothetical protein n=1 Tax=Vibrio cincinnatiensis TaxID=675 RepID=UPI001FAAD4E5